MINHNLNKTINYQSLTVSKISFSFVSRLPAKGCSPVKSNLSLKLQFDIEKSISNDLTRDHQAYGKDLDMRKFEYYPYEKVYSDCFC